MKSLSTCHAISDVSWLETGPWPAVTSPYPTDVPSVTFTSTMRRSWVTPKLVSNGFRSCIRSSRISICLINTRRSSHEQILAPLVFPLKAGGEIVLLEVFQKLLANPPLDLLCRGDALLFEGLNISWYAHAPNVALDLDSRLINPPLRDHAVAFKALLQTRRNLSVKVHVIPADDRTQLFDIQMGIL